jgi:hypothetical protein
VSLFEASTRKLGERIEVSGGKQGQVDLLQKNGELFAAREPDFGMGRKKSGLGKCRDVLLATVALHEDVAGAIADA